MCLSCVFKSSRLLTLCSRCHVVFYAKLTVIFSCIHRVLPVDLRDFDAVQLLSFEYMCGSSVNGVDVYWAFGRNGSA